MTKRTPFEHAARILAELFTQPDPYPDEPTPDTDDTFFARNYYEAARRTDGTTAPGNVIRSVVRVGHNRWKIVDRRRE